MKRSRKIIIVAAILLVAGVFFNVFLPWYGRRQVAWIKSHPERYYYTKSEYNRVDFAFLGNTKIEIDSIRSYWVDINKGIKHRKIQFPLNSIAVNRPVYVLDTLGDSSVFRIGYFDELGVYRNALALPEHLHISRPDSLGQPWEW